MSDYERSPEDVAPRRQSNCGWNGLLIVIGLALLGVNGWLVYQTWLLNQTLTTFVAQRSAPPAFVEGGAPAEGFPGAASRPRIAATPAPDEVSDAPAPTRAPARPADGATPATQATAAPLPATNAADAATDLTAASPGVRGPRPGADQAGATQGDPGAARPGPGGAVRTPAAPAVTGVLTASTDAGAPPPLPPVAGDVDAAPAAPSPSPVAPGDSAPTAAQTAAIPVVTGVKGARVWDDAGVLLTVYDSGVTLTATGRSSNGDWLIVESEAGPGWVQTDQLIAYGVQQLAVATLPPSTALAPMLDLATMMTTSAPVTATAPPAPDALAVFPVTATPLAPTASGVSVTLPAAFTATVIITDARLNVRAGPGVAYPIIAKADPGAVYAVTGRDSSGAWLQVRIATDGAAGWVDAAFVQVSGAIDALPAPPIPPVPTPTPVNTPTMEPAAAGSAAAASQQLAAASLGLQGTIVFQQSRGGMIYAYFPATGELRPLTHGVDPAVSPDGDVVAFTRDGGETGVYLIDSDGANERRIFTRPSLSSPKWSPDGQWILFSRYDDYIECYDIGRNECLIPEVFFDRFPFADPDRFPLVKEYLHRLAAVDRNGQNYHDIPALDSARAPDWAEGGIVYQSKAGLQRTQDSQDIATQTVAFDTLNPYYFDPDWQPGGDQIVFQLKGAAQTDLWVVNADGSNRRPLTAPKTVLVDQLPSNVAPAYSPDGAHIVFLSNRDARNAAGAWRIWVMDAAGENQTPLPIDLLIEYNFGLEQVVSWGG